MVNATFDLNTFEYFLLVLVRISSFITVAPFFNQSAVPTRTKLGFSAIIAIMLFQTVPHVDVVYSSVFGYAALVIKEAITGLLIGFMANMCNNIILLAGTVIDMDIGLSMAQVFDPQTGSQVSVTGNLYQYFLLLLMLVSDMHRYIIRAAIDSFQVVPLAGAVFDIDSLLSTFVTYLLDLFIISFRIVLPVFACIMILNCILGILVKVAPQINMFSVGIQLKILVGFAVIFITIFMFPQVANMIITEMKTMMVSIIEGMY